MPNERKIRNLLAEFLQHPEVRAQDRSNIIRALLQSTDSIDLDTVFAALKNTPMEDAMECVEGIAYAQPKWEKEVQDRLLKFASNSSINVTLRAEAVGALIRPTSEGKPAIDPRIIDLAGQLVKADGLTEVARKRLYAFLSKTGDPRLIVILERLMQAGTPREKREAASFLAWNRGDVQSVDTLIQIAKSENKRRR
jgi:hypothetical protein